MTIVLFILIVIISVILGLIILIQNPKGGGLSGTLAGFNNQFMGVKQTTDVLEKGTWLFAGIIGVLCLFSTIFISAKSSGSSGPDLGKPAATAPAQNTPAQNLQLPTGIPDSTKK